MLLAAVVAIVVGMLAPAPDDAAAPTSRRGRRMSPTATWVAVIAASAVVFALKLVGHLVPEHWLAKPRVARTAALVTVALLSALVAVQAATIGRHLVADARLARARRGGRRPDAAGTVHRGRRPRRRDRRRAARPGHGLTAT